MPTPHRLSRLPSHQLPGGLRLAVAATPWSRLLGLMGLEAIDCGHALLLPRCRSVHTIGMRFALDLLWLDGDGALVRIDRGVPPRRMRGCMRARSVIEVRAGEADAFGKAGVGAPPARYSAPR